jgi:iron only hydrogenase large subunit-like protein/ferredoxin
MSHHEPNPNKIINLTIDGIPVAVPEGTRILEAARIANIHIPTLCEHPDLCKRAHCRVCVVECDGRGKLIAACANEVWEGVNIVTHNSRLASVRKMILELILAEHPQECLSCIRNTRCELQKLAADFNIRESSFRHFVKANNTPVYSEPDCGKPVIESKTLVRDMEKCVKCSRCVEACQEVQAIRSINTAYRSIHYEISTPYGQALADGPCVFCGQCAAVCPVGAIYEYDQSAEVRAALNDSSNRVIAQIPQTLGEAFDEALGLPAGTVSPGKIVTALRRLGFDQVFDAAVSAGAVQAAEISEVQTRIKNGLSNLPLITGCSMGCFKFVEDSYPDLANCLSSCKNTQQMFSTYAKTLYPQQSITTVSIFGCLAHKFTYNAPPTDTIALTVNEIARMFTLAGINFNGLPETAFDCMEGTTGAETPAAESEIKTLTVNGFAQAHTVMDSIRKGECNATLVRIKSCPNSHETAEGC